VAQVDWCHSEVILIMWFELVGTIREVERIAAGGSLRERKRLRRAYGPGRWRKMKGVADVRLRDDIIVRAEVHWYEAHGVGRREMKIKRFLK